MASSNSTYSSILYAVAIAIGVAVSASYLMPKGEPASAATAAVAQSPKPQPRAQWEAAAPGRVEPNGGEVKIGSLAPGRIVEVAVKPNDRVTAGDLMVRLDDDDATARLQAAVAEAAVRKRERDTAETGLNKLVVDRRQAEDTVAATERELSRARAERDAAVAGHRRTPTTEAFEQVSAAREQVRSIEQRLGSERVTLRRAQAVAGVPLPTRLEAALTAARSDLSLAEAALERTRIRAPADATVLQVNARVGETASPSPEQVLVMVGDLASLRVRAEVEERDAAKVRVGQRVVVRSDAHPGKEFEGKVAMLAPSLGPSKIAQRGPRRPNDIEVLEVLVELDGLPPLLPGMRVDVLFKPTATVSEGMTKTN